MTCLRLGLCLLLGCAVTQTGNPELDVSSVGAVYCPDGMCLFGDWEIAAPAESVAPGRGTIRVWGIDFPGMYTAEVAEDGSWSVRAQSSLLHLDLLQDGKRSPSANLRITGSDEGEASVVENITGSTCLSLSAEGPLEVQSSLSFSVTNDCSAPASVRVLTMGSAFSLEGSSEVPAGIDMTLTIRADVGADDDVLVVQSGDELLTATIYVNE